MELMVIAVVGILIQSNESKLLEYCITSFWHCNDLIVSQMMMIPILLNVEAIKGEALVV